MNSTLLNADLVEYCFENVTDSCIKQTRSISSRVAIYLVLALITTTTVLGNLVVIVSISHYKQLNTPSNLLVQSLATTDVLVGVCLLPFTAMRTVDSCWYLGFYFCRLHSFLEIVFCTASGVHLLFIGIERYYAVCNPLSYSRCITFRLIRVFIILSWGLPTIYSFSDIFFISTNEDNFACRGECYVLYNKAWKHTLTVYIFFVVFFLVPSVSMIVLYTLIFKVARKQARKIQAMENKNIYIETNDNKNKRKKEQKAAKTLGTVMGVMLFCYTPYFVTVLVNTHITLYTLKGVIECIMWLGYFNSTCNPFIYAFFFQWFRIAMKNILTCKICIANS